MVTQTTQSTRAVETDRNTKLQAFVFVLDKSVTTQEVAKVMLDS